MFLAAGGQQAPDASPVPHFTAIRCDDGDRQSKGSWLMGRAEELFLRIKHAGATEIDRMIDDEVVEELFLDYKRAATVDPFQKLDVSDRKNLAKAIAGFANSEGGVIVWGVDCRQNPPHGDVPTKPIPITNPNAFKSLLEGSLTGLTLPAHPGVENVSLQIKGR